MGLVIFRDFAGMPLPQSIQFDEKGQGFKLVAMIVDHQPMTVP